MSTFTVERQSSNHGSSLIRRAVHVRGRAPIDGEKAEAAARSARASRMVVCMVFGACRLRGTECESARRVGFAHPLWYSRGQPARGRAASQQVKGQDKASEASAALRLDLTSTCPGNTRESAPANADASRVVFGRDALS